MNHRIRTKALKTLDGMEEIVRAERMERGVYISEVEDLSRKNAICGGRRACLVGSMWLGYGVRVVPNRDHLPGVDQYSRDDFLRNNPALKLVYDTMELVVERKLKRLGVNPDVLSTIFSYLPERLFEESYSVLGRNLTRGELLQIIKSTRREIVKAN